MLHFAKRVRDASLLVHKVAKQYSGLAKIDGREYAREEDPPPLAILLALSIVPGSRLNKK
jgi:hypothetical protein